MINPTSSFQQQEEEEERTRTAPLSSSLSSVDALPRHPPADTRMPVVSGAVPSAALSAVGPSCMLRELHSDIFKKYKVIQSIGKGSMGNIELVQLRDGKLGGSAFHIKNKKGLFGLGILPVHKTIQTVSHIPEKSQDYIYAMKSIVLDRVSPTFVQELKNEIEILRSMDHPNIVKAYEVYTFHRKIYIVMELCHGGDLYKRAPYSEKQSASIVEQILCAVRYMHEHGIVHRDLKFENIMFASTLPDSQIKVIDFGLSKKFMDKNIGIMSERVGTIYTMSPQVLEGIYSSNADLWSMGVITFMLLSSSKPFYHHHMRRMMSLIIRGEYHYQGPIWDHISQDAKDFINHLLVVNPNERYDAEQAIHHPWIIHREQLHNEIPSLEIFEKVDHSLLNYRNSSDLKKLALTVVAYQSTQTQIIELRKVFDQYDTEQNGVLSYEEFRFALQKTKHYPDHVIEEIFSSIDIDKNGEIMWTEFLAATISAHGNIEEDRIAEAFDRLDVDQTGFISIQDLREFLGTNCPCDQLDSIIKMADQNSDGKVSYKEFLLVFREQTTQLKQSLTNIETHDDDDGNVDAYG